MAYMDTAYSHQPQATGQWLSTAAPDFTHENLSGWTDWISAVGGAAKTVGGWAFGAGKAAAQFSNAMSKRIGSGPEADRWRQLMEKAGTVAQQIQVFQQAILTVQQRLGRQMSPAEVQQMEQDVFGPAGIPTNLPGETPAVSAAGPDLSSLMPLLLVGGVFLVSRKALPLVLLAGGAWWFLQQQRTGG